MTIKLGAPSDTVLRMLEVLEVLVDQAELLEEFQRPQIQ
jgi:hypothetical protein